jgi:hypothetical protein
LVLFHISPTLNASQSQAVEGYRQGILRCQGIAHPKILRHSLRSNFKGVFVAEPQLARFRQTLKTAIQTRQAETASARQVIYDAMEKAFERSVVAHPERYAAVDLTSLRLSLRNAIKSVEDDHREISLPVAAAGTIDVGLEDLRLAAETGKKTVSAETAAKPRRLMWPLTALGVVVAAVFASFLLSQNLPSRAGGAEFEVSGQIPLIARKGFSVAADKQGGFTRLSWTSEATVKDKIGIGAFLQLSSELEENFSGKQIAIDISARSSPQNGADHLSAAYFTQGVGNSGWRELPLESEFSPATFEFKVPERKGEPGKDYLGLVPGKLGQGGSVDIQSVQIRILK